MAKVSDVEVMHRELEGSWSRKMADFENRLKAASTPTNTSLNQLREEFYEFKDLVSSVLNHLRQQIHACTITIDVIDMQHRQNILLFNGISDSPEVNIEQEILSIIHNKMCIPHVTNVSLSRCHRIGVQKDGHSRPILVQFQEYRTKSEVWKAKTKLKGSQVSVSEFLTKLRQSVHKKARKHFGLKNVWTLDGTIFIKLPNNERAKISTEEEIDTLIEKFPVDCSPASQAIASNSGFTNVTKKPIQAQQSSSSTKSQREISRRNLDGTVGQKEDPKRSRRLIAKK